MENLIPISNLIVLIATLVVIVIYTIETYKLRVINSRNFELERIKLKPNLVVLLDFNPKDTEIYFRVKNIGGGTAYNISIKFEPDLNFGMKGTNEVIYFSNENNKLSVLLPNTEHNTIVGFTSNSMNLYKNNEIPIEYLVKAEYFDSFNLKYSNSQIINVHHLFSRLLDENPIEKALVEINKTLIDIQIKLKP